MKIHFDVPLKNYTTMRLGGNAQYFADFESIDELRNIIDTVKPHNLPIFVLGGGSNTIVHDEGFAGIVARNNIKGYEEVSRELSSIRIKAGGGENWDDTVERVVQSGWSGIEALSGIPGTVGAAPVQNIGAYGQEVSDTIVELEVIDLQTGELLVFDNDACNFGYRSSIFRDNHPQKYCIVSVTFELSSAPPLPPFYAAVEKYFSEHQITDYTVSAVRDAVIAIREDKLPDPKKQPNSGSFFKNAVIEDWLFQELLTTYPNMPSYDMPDDMHKIPTGWLIDKAGLKGQLIHGMRVHTKNALVLINESATSYDDLNAAREAIKDAVRTQFRIEIEQEPLEL